MSLNKLDKYEIRHRALLEAIRFCGGVAAYSNRIKVSRTRASNWRNQPEITIPYEYVVLTEDVTRVSIERLSPYTEAANTVIRRLRTSDKLPPIDIAFNEIIIGNYPYYRYTKQDCPIIVGTDRVLISGLARIEAQKAIRMKRTPVMVLDLESLLLGVRSIKGMNDNFLMSEKIAIGLRLEQLMSGKQYKQNSLNGHVCAGINNTALCCICDEVKKRDNKIAHIIGLPSRDMYYHARQAYLSGNSELINILDQKQASIVKAER